MDLLLCSLLIYLLGTMTIIWPHKLEMAAHYAGTACAIIASGMVAVISICYLVMPVGGLLVDTGWGSYSLAADGWSSVFLAITGIAGFFISIYALDYAKGYRGSRIRALTGLWNLFLLSIVAVLIAGDAFTFIVAWEIMALVSFLLVNHEADRKETVSAAYQYMVMTHLGTAAILVAFYLLGSHSASFSFVDMMQNTLDGSLKHIAFGCAFAGFALKSGLMPLHTWLPNAHPAAPSHVSALMSGVMLKVALYGFGRFAFQFIGMDNIWYGLIVMIVGLLSAFLGVLYATMEVDMKRILAYSSVENMGIIFGAFGCGMLLMAMHLMPLAIVAFTAATVHAFSHSLMKGLMFMSAGAVMHATGSKNIEKMGGLLKKMPYTAFFTLIGAMALSSLPFTSGLVGEWLVLQSFISLGTSCAGQDIRLWTAVSFILLGFTGALALGCFVRFFGITFLGRARSEIVEHAHESDKFMLAAMGVASVLVVACGLYPLPVVRAALLALGMPVALDAFGMNLAWAGVGTAVCYKPLLLLVLLLVLGAVLWLAVKDCFVVEDVTWNCGTYPTQRQQYSATGFSKPVRRAFDYLLKPKRQVTYMRKEHAYFGRQLSYKLEIPDMITEKLYQPLQKHFVSVSNFLRRLQQGSVRLYVAYVMVAMMFVLVWGALYK